MLRNITERVIAALAEAGIPASAAWPRTAMDRSVPSVRVSLARAEAAEGARPRYLGLLGDAELGDREVYGLCCTLELRLDIYAPAAGGTGPETCLDLFDHAAALIGGIPGLELRTLRCGAPEPDAASGMIHLRGEAAGIALVTVRTDSGHEEAFIDFVLRGELNQ